MSRRSCCSPRREVLRIRAAADVFLDSLDERPAPGGGGASLLMLMAKSRHKKPENVRRCFPPSAEAIAEVASLLAPGDGRR